MKFWNELAKLMVKTAVAAATSAMVTRAVNRIFKQTKDKEPPPPPPVEVIFNETE